MSNLAGASPEGADRAWSIMGEALWSLCRKGGARWWTLQPGRLRNSGLLPWSSAACRRPGARVRVASSRFFEARAMGLRDLKKRGPEISSPIGGFGTWQASEARGAGDCE